MFMLIPAVISLIISLTAVNLGIPGGFYYPGNGKVFGAAEASGGNGGMFKPMAEEARKFDNFVSVTMNDLAKIASDSGLPGKMAFGILPKNPDVPREPVRKNEAERIELPCLSSAVIDLKTAKLLYDKNSRVKTSIASISKLMTALVFLDHNSGWDSVYEVKPEDRREGGKIYLTPGERVKVKDLFYSSLVASDNIATIALVRSTGLTEEGFVAQMNKKAEALGLEDTHFSDPLGLVDANVSTAMEVAKFAQAALSNEEIKKATLTKKYEFSAVDGKKKTIHNTDNLLSVFPKDGVELRGGKTGYTEAAGYCFVGEFTDQDGHDVISVVLGSGDKDDRFKFTHDLIGWIYDNYIW